MQEIQSPESASRMPSRRGLILRRWADVVLCGVFGAAVIFIIAFGWPERWKVCEQFLDTVPTFVTAIVAIAVLLGFLKLGWRRFWALLGVRHLSYAPIWVGGVVGTVIVRVGLARNVQEGLIQCCKLALMLVPSSTVGLFLSFIVIVASMVVWMKRETGRETNLQHNRKPAENHRSNGVEFKTFDELEAWAKNDNPIEESKADRFQRDSQVKRIASRLLLEKPPSQAVVGALGSGKSTLGRFVKKELQRSEKGKHVRMVQVELWPYKTPNAAVQGILQALINELANEVSVLSIQGVPKEYADAINPAGGFWPTIASAIRLQPAHDPIGTLKSLDKIAITIGVRLVVWIDDLERFAGAASSSSTESRLNSIRALLHGLSKQNSIMVVTATTTLSAQFDIEKIAQFVEEIPRMPLETVGKILGFFREYCLSHVQIDSMERRDRRGLAIVRDEESLKLACELKNSLGFPVQLAVVEVCRTPRDLKQAIRNCLDVWGTLAGELDFDDLLVLSLVRASHPMAFAAINDHLRFHRDDWSQEDKKADAGRAWKLAISKAVPEKMALEIVLELVGFLFGADRANRPQGVWAQNHVDYWQRYLAMSPVPSDESDQRVLRALTSKDAQLLLDLIDDPNRLSAVNDFAGCASFECAMDILPRWVERHVNSQVPADETRYPGLKAIVQIWGTIKVRGEFKNSIAIEVLNRVFANTVKTDLSLVMAISTELVNQTVLPPILANKTTSSIRRLLSETYRGKGADLIRSLRGAPEDVLIRLYRQEGEALGDLASQYDLDRFSLDDWTDFTAAILEAAQSEPDFMLPYVAFMLVNIITSPKGERFEYNDLRATKLFGGKSALQAVFPKERMKSRLPSKLVDDFLAGLHS